MALRTILAERLAPIKKRLKLETPVIEEAPLLAKVISSIELAFPSILGKIPVIVRGKAYGETAGYWYRVSFPRALSEPSVVCVGEARGGLIPTVPAPKVTIASVGVASTKVGVPKTIPVEIPVTAIPYINESFPYFISDFAWVRKQICEPLNELVKSLYRVQSRLNEGIRRINDGFAKTKKAVQDTNASLSDFRGKVESSINTGLRSSRDNAQRALNTTIKNTESAVNERLAAIIPALYNAWGISSRMTITPIHVRNVTSTGFEFQSYGKTTCYYIAVGSR